MLWQEKENRPPDWNFATPGAFHNRDLVHILKIGNDLLPETCSKGLEMITQGVAGSSADVGAIFIVLARLQAHRKDQDYGSFE